MRERCMVEVSTRSGELPKMPSAVVGFSQTMRPHPLSNSTRCTTRPWAVNAERTRDGGVPERFPENSKTLPSSQRLRMRFLNSALKKHLHKLAGYKFALNYCKIESLPSHRCFKHLHHCVQLAPSWSAKEHSLRVRKVKRFLQTF